MGGVSLVLGPDMVSGLFCVKFLWIFFYIFLDMVGKNLHTESNERG